MSEARVAIVTEGVGGGTSDNGGNELVVSGEPALTRVCVDEVAGGPSRWGDWGILSVDAGGSDCLSLDFSAVAEGKEDSKG